MKNSIVIPVYNSEKTIVKSIESVISESAVNPYDWELILVDDGSKDKSVDLIQNYMEISPYKDRIRLIRQQNSGAAAARNTGIKAATGDFVSFNDSDDVWLAGKLKMQMEYLINHPEVDMVGGAYELEKFPSTFKKLGEITRIKITDIIKKNYFSPPTVIIRKKILDDTGLLFDDSMRTGGEEGSLFYPLTYYGNCVLINKKVAESILHKAQWGASGLSGNIIAMEKGVIRNKKMAYKNGYISLPVFIGVYLLSYVKAARRIVIRMFRK